MTINIPIPTSTAMPTSKQPVTTAVRNDTVTARPATQALPATGTTLPPEAANISPAPPPAQADIERAVEMFQQHASNIGRDLLFEIDDESGQTVIKVIDPQTEEVVRQIPSEEAVERARVHGEGGMNLIDASI